MCGIVGWVSYDRDPAAERAIVLAMTRTMAARGPDAEGIWLSAHCALGHRRLSVIDLEGGRQPMVRGDGGKPVTGPDDCAAALTYSGEVYNFRELRAQLAARGHIFTTRSDTEVVLNAYLAWGEECLPRLDGIFAFAIWDARREQLLLARDQMGVKPLYYYPLPDGLLFGSEPKAILAHPAASPAITTDGLREVLSVAKNPGSAVFHGMREVPPGCLVRVGRFGTSVSRYWSLEVKEHTDGLPATVARLRELLADTLTRQMIADVPLCTLLSGGLDSSTLTAFAAASAAGADRVRSYSVRDPAATAGGSPYGPGANEDYRYARMVAEHARTRHTEMPLDTRGLLDPGLRSAVLGAYDLPIAKGDEHASLHLLFRAVREHSTVALSGECGDEVFGGYRWQHNPDAIYSQTFPWVHSGRHRYAGNEVVFDRGLLGQLDLPSFERDSHQTAVAEIAARDVIADPAEARRREVTYLALTRHAQVLFDRKDRMSMATGLEVRVPYAATQLVEYTFNIPWSMKTFDGREKSLLRAAGQGMLPRAVAMRVKTPYPSVRDQAYDRTLRERLAGLVQDKDAGLAPFLSGRLRQEVRQRGAQALADGVSRACMETVLQLEEWVGRYNVRMLL